MTTLLDGYFVWLGARRIGRIESEVSSGGEVTDVVLHAITSVPQSMTDAATLLRWHRGHWDIKDRLHWVRGVTMGEDGNRTRTGSGPQVLAAL